MSPVSYSEYMKVLNVVQSLTILDRNKLVMYCGYNNPDFNDNQNKNIRDTAKRFLENNLSQLDWATQNKDGNVSEKVDYLVQTNTEYIENTDVSHLFNEEGW